MQIFHDTFLDANSTTGNFSILPISLLIASLSNGEKHFSLFGKHLHICLFWFTNKIVLGIPLHMLKKQFFLLEL